MFIPFICVLFYLEWKRNPSKWLSPISFFALGCITSGLTLLPTLLTYGYVMMKGSGDYISLDFKKFLAVFDLFVRYLGTATTDVIHNMNFIKLFSEKSWIGFILIWTVKLFAVFQFMGICISLFFVEKSIEFRKTILLFFLTLIMALFLYILSNKHLEMRTYVLLYPVPLWLSLFSYSFLIKYRYVRWILNTSLILMFLTSFGIAISNFNDKYSFKSVENKIEKAIYNKNPGEFAERRKTLMDRYD
jgi:hypothetical protein